MPAVLSTILATTFIIAIINLHSLCSASSMQESIDKAHIAVREVLNSRGVPSRVHPPPDQKCDVKAHWSSRICFTHFGDDALWFDYCDRGPGHGMYSRAGKCPSNHMCQDTMGFGERRTIICVSRATSSSQTEPDQQIGFHFVQNAEGLMNARQDVAVPVQSNMANATAAALIEGTDGNYVVAANNAIVGTLRGTTLKLCDYNATTRACMPTVPHTLTAGDTVDFTFGLGPYQQVNFYYALVPNSG